MNISILKEYDRCTVLVEAQEQRRFYIPDLYAIVYTATNEFSLYATDTNALLYDHLKAIDFIAPTGTALQIIDALGIPYIADNGQATITNYLHTQTQESDTWNVVHPLNKMYCNVMVISIDNKNIECTDIEFLTPTRLKITFSEPYEGYAYLS